MTRIETAIVVESLPRGRWLAWPLAAPDLVQYGKPEDDARLLMSLVLPEHIKPLPGSQRSRFATPRGTRLGTAQVTFQREDLPERLARSLTFAVPWAATPFGRELWLHVLPLKLVLRADPPHDDASLSTLVASEVQRVLAATEPTPQTLLELFPAHGHRLEWIDVELDADVAKVGRAAHALAIAAEEANKILLSVGTALHAERRILEGAPLVARPKELELVDKLLQKGSVLVHGAELAGKTALVEGWIRARAPDESLGSQPSLLVYATSGARLMAGMSGLGQWQERLRRVLAAAETLKAILWIEHLGELVGESGHGQELANALRPWLEEGRVRVVTELRDGEIDRLERQYGPLVSVFRRVKVEPLGVADTLAVLEQRAAHIRMRDPKAVHIQPAALPEVVALAGRYQAHVAQPGASVRLSEDLRGLARPDSGADLDVRGVLKTFSALTGLPAWLLDDQRPFDVEATQAALAKQVIGQDEAVRAVAETLAVIKTRMAARGKPLASLLFAGPTGVGKTELARALAIHLFGSDTRLARFDMSEFMDAAAAERLIRGADGMKDGLLTRRLRKEPLSVVLLDEIEKAHRSVFDLLLQALGEGRLTDASGRTASLEGCIVVLTSNIGATDKVKRIGLLDEGAGALADHYLKEVRKHFAPEMVNRLERIIPFAALGPETLRKVVRLQVDKVRRRRGMRPIVLDVSEDALDHIAAAGTTPQYGARALRRAVDRLLVAPLAHTIARQPTGTVARVDVSLEDRKLRFVPETRSLQSADLRLIQRVANLRRQARGYLRSPAVLEVRDRVELLDAELLRGASPGPVMADRARLMSLVAPFEAAKVELEELEDLMFLATLPGQPPLASSDVDAELAGLDRKSQELEADLFELLVALDPRRDVALVALTELDENRGFDRWLLPLLEAAEQRRWQVRAWIEGEHGEGWPSTVGLGPARSADELYVRLVERPSDFRHLVLGVRGRHAATLMACEQGTIIFRGKDHPPTSLHVKLLSLGKHELDPDMLLDTESWRAPPVESRGPMSNGRFARAFYSDHQRMTLVAAEFQRVAYGWVPEYFAAWERHAAQHLTTYDQHRMHSRSDVFESPLDEELLVRRLLREMAERSRHE